MNFALVILIPLIPGLMAETLGFRSIFVVVLVLTAVAALCILRS